MKKFCPRKVTIKDMDRQMIDLEEIMTKCLFNKRLEFSVSIELKTRIITNLV